MRRPGLDTRLMPEMVRARSGVYFMVISRVFPGFPGSSFTWYPTMYPSSTRMAASDSLSFEPGILTVSKWAVLAFRMRVSMSAIGSVIVIVGRLLSPTGLRHTGNFAGVDHHPQADPAQAELAVHRLGSAAPTASGVPAHLELGRALLLFDQSLLGHGVTGSPVGTGSRRRPAVLGPLRRCVRWWRW